MDTKPHRGLPGGDRQVGREVCGVFSSAGGDLEDIQGLAVPGQEVGLEDLEDGLLVPAGGRAEALARVLSVAGEAGLARELHRRCPPTLLLPRPEEQHRRREGAARAAGQRQGGAWARPGAQTVHAGAMVPSDECFLGSAECTLSSV